MTALAFITKFNNEFHKNVIKKNDPTALHNTDKLRKSLYARENAKNFDVRSRFKDLFVHISHLRMAEIPQSVMCEKRRAELEDEINHPDEDNLSGVNTSLIEPSKRGHPEGRHKKRMQATMSKKKLKATHPPRTTTAEAPATLPKELQDQIKALSSIATAHHLLNEGMFSYGKAPLVHHSLEFLSALHKQLADEALAHPDADKSEDLKNLRINRDAAKPAQQGAENGQISH